MILSHTRLRRRPKRLRFRYIGLALLAAFLAPWFGGNHAGDRPRPTAARTGSPCRDGHPAIPPAIRPIPDPAVPRPAHRADPSVAAGPSPSLLPAPSSSVNLPPYVKRSRQLPPAASAWPLPSTSVGSCQQVRLFDDTELTLEWTEKVTHASNNHAWYGRLAEDPLAAVTLTRVGGHSILDIQSPELGHFEVRGEDGGPGEVREFDCARIQRGCPTCRGVAAFGDSPVESAGEAPASEEPPVIAAAEPVTIDVLMVYTAKARTEAGSRSAIVAKCQSAVNGQNSNFSRSQISHRMRLVQTREVGHTATGNLVTELEWVAGNSTVADVRNTAGADIVAMLSDRDDLNMFGVAQQLTSTGGNSGQAFSANYYDTVAGVWPHEVGHNLGCQHNSAGVYSYSSGHYWTDSSNGKQYGTIMSYIGQRIPYFSNPDVSYSGHATGTSSRDNARSIENIGDNVAGYRSAKTLVEPSCALAASSTGPQEGADFTLTVTTTNGGPSAASACQITVTLPSRLSLVAHDGGSAFNTGTRVWTVPSLANDATAKLNLTVRPNAGSAGISLAPKATLTSIGSSFVDFDLYNNEGTVTVVPRPVALTDLLIHYPLDESTGTTAADVSAEGGAQNAATSHANPLWLPDGGVIGGALRLASTAQSDVAQAFAHNSSTSLVQDYPFTIAMWVRLAPPAWNQAGAYLGDATLESSYYNLGIAAAAPQSARAIARNTTVRAALSPPELPVADNQWHHLAAVFTANLRTLHLDGVAVGTDTTSVNFVSNIKRFAIGSLARKTPTDAFVGDIDDVGLWTSPLDARRIALIHGLGRHSGASLDDPAIDTLLAVHAGGAGFAAAGGMLWVPATRLPAPVGSNGVLPDGRRFITLASDGSGLVALTRPDLVLSRPAGGGLTLSWHSGFADWTLQESADLAGGSWADCLLPVNDDGTTRSVEVPVGESDRRFFRLAKP